MAPGCSAHVLVRLLWHGARGILPVYPDYSSRWHSPVPLATMAIPALSEPPGPQSLHRAPRLPHTWGQIPVLALTSCGTPGKTELFCTRFLLLKGVTTPTVQRAEGQVSKST